MSEYKNVQCVACLGNGFRMVGTRDSIEGSKMQSREVCDRRQGKFITIFDGTNNAPLTHHD